MKVTVLGILVLVGVASGADAQPAIYRCAGASGTVYSDRPCGADADQHQTDTSRVTVYTPAPTPERTLPAATANKAASKRPKSGRGAGTDPAKHGLKCAKLDQALREVRTKMRTGYGAKEGERLKARQQRLGEQRRTEKCR
ncbi:DUF4124 domain-containing protein [Steroidobacter sp.]|uniref:DUF4124 domain-containing protein n=1 Tax=Steroidobacter sp. TaxID=1978227 RepID=UPI001A434DA4|nr:DUF4124 domain-containing protein [Steroidobacter sp.]MBL8267433.1 DUF4124 domain-containing protein [Steroidobacter sp.]